MLVGASSLPSSLLLVRSSCSPMVVKEPGRRWPSTGEKTGLLFPRSRSRRLIPLAPARGPRVILDTFRWNRKMEAISALPFSYGYVIRSSFQAFRINDSKEGLVSLVIFFFLFFFIHLVRLFDKLTTDWAFNERSLARIRVLKREFLVNFGYYILAISLCSFL